MHYATILQGAFVVTTCSKESADLCKELGADYTIDYRTQRFVLSQALGGLPKYSFEGGREAKGSLFEALYVPSHYVPTTYMCMHLLL